MHYAPTRDDVVYRSELDRDREPASKRAPRPCIHTRPGCGDLSGHLCREHLGAVAPDRAAPETYVCGPPGLIESARRIWAEDGVEEQLHIESFLPPSPGIAGDRAEGSVSFARTGERVANSGRSLLEQAERAGLSPAVRLPDGHLPHLHLPQDGGHRPQLITGEISSAEDEDIQICVSVPAGDVELDL